MTLKKTEATLEELVQNRDRIKTQIRDLQRQEKTIKGTIKSIERLTASMPAEKPARRKKARAAAASA
jgi:hypothetical protein